MPTGVGWQLRDGGGGNQAQERRRDCAGPGQPVGLREHRELLQVRDFPQINLFGQLAAHRRPHVLVVAQLAPGQRPRTTFGILGALPEQHAKLGFLRLRAWSEPANLEYDGEHFVRSATIDHVFDYKSKTLAVPRGERIDYGSRELHRRTVKRTGY